MLIIDAHEDIAYNALEWGRDSVYVVRKREEGAGCCESSYTSGNASAGPGGIAMSGLPELRRMDKKNVVMVLIS